MGIKARGLWWDHMAFRVIAKKNLAEFLLENDRRDGPYPDPATPPRWVILQELVYRYMRANKIRFSVENWNYFCREIANKTRMYHSGTLKRATIETGREKSPLRITLDGIRLRFIGPRFYQWDVRKRLSRIKANKEKKESDRREYIEMWQSFVICEMCFKRGELKVTDIYWRDVKASNHRSMQIFDGRGDLELCLSCWNRVKPVVKRAKEADALRLDIQRMKKELRNGNQHNRKSASCAG